MDFFPRIRPGQVYRMFRDRLGCSPRIAKILTRIVTLDGGIPQGSPTSTTVANLVIVPLATRLNGLATCHGSDYSQFVDDGAISGPAYLEKLRPLVDEIVRQEGFLASPKEKKRKTLYWYQEQVVTGVKVNRKIDAPQEKVDEASAFLDGIQVQLACGSKVSDREIRSVAGKVQHIRNLNPNKGLRLKKRLDTFLN
jgi:RNA-directed DNA polymerase